MTENFADYPLCPVDDDLLAQFIQGKMKCLVFRGNEIYDYIEDPAFEFSAPEFTLVSSTDFAHVYGVVSIDTEYTDTPQEIYKQFASLLGAQDTFFKLVGDCDLVTVCTLNYQKLGKIK